MRKLAVIAFALFLVSIFVFAQNSSNPPVSTPTTAPKVASLPPEAQQAMATINPERIRAHVKFLASDLLEGRGTGQRGGDIAAEYIATEFSLYGLKPAGDNGSYMQKVPMVGIKTVDDGTTFSLVSEEWRAPESHRSHGLRRDGRNRQDGHHDRRTAGLDGLRDRRSRVQVERLCRRRCEGQDFADAGQRAAIRRSELLQGQGPDVLRPLGLQIRRSCAHGSCRRYPHPQDRDGELRLGRGAQFVGRRAVVSAQ